jgi:hypothetical protein
MDGKELHSKNKLYTPKSGTTIYIDYSEKRKILEVEFTAGNVYHYLKVEPLVWEEYRDLILSGGSSGEFVNQKIKPNYTLRKIR